MKYFFMNVEAGKGKEAAIEDAIGASC